MLLQTPSLSCLVTSHVHDYPSPNAPWPNCTGTVGLGEEIWDLTWTWMWHLNICCGWFTTFSDLVFIGCRKISDGRDKRCGCNLDAASHYNHYNTCNGMSKRHAGTLQECPALLESTGDFFHQLTWAPNHIRNECARSQQQHQHTGLGGVMSLNHTERETGRGESSLCYFTGGRFKHTVFSRTFRGVAKCSFKIIQFPLQNGVKNPY